MSITKNLMTFATSLLFWTATEAQKVITFSIPDTLLFTGINNPLRIISSKYALDKIKLEPVEGVITKSYGRGDFTWRICNKTGRCKLRIFYDDHGSKKLIDSQFFSVQRIEDPIIRIMPLAGYTDNGEPLWLFPDAIARNNNNFHL